MPTIDEQIVMKLASENNRKLKEIKRLKRERTMLIVLSMTLGAVSAYLLALIIVVTR